MRTETYSRARMYLASNGENGLDAVLCATFKAIVLTAVGLTILGTLFHHLYSLFF